MKDARSNEELNRVIAEWCGARFFTEDGGGFWHFVTKDGRAFGPPTEDLNAIHEAMQHMTDKQVGQFMNRIVELCPVKDVQGWWSVVNSTARQRAEALVAVIEANK